MDKEYITLYVTISAQHSVILGLPWLDQHKYTISWTDRKIMHWSPYCQEQFFHWAVIPPATTTFKSPDQMNSVHIPSEYQDLQETFSKERASGLPAHHPNDCAITVLSGASRPQERVYLLSLDEQRAMEEYTTMCAWPCHMGALAPSSCSSA